MTHPQVDEDIFARYDFGEARPLGAGGYGSVYLAKDRTHRGRIVAVKKAMMMDGDSVHMGSDDGLWREHPNLKWFIYG